jgi:hypothetical protein
MVALVLFISGCWYPEVMCVARQRLIPSCDQKEKRGKEKIAQFG